jgi:hypothetical protein
MQNAAGAAATEAAQAQYQIAEDWIDLMTRLGGFTQATTSELSFNGLTDLTTMLEFSKDDLKQMMEHLMKYPHPSRPAGVIVYVSAPGKHNLYTAVYWAKLQLRYGMMPQSANLNDAALVATKVWLKEIKAFKRSEEKQDIAKPPKLKKMSDWTRFWEAARTYFGSTRGAADIPLSYVFRGEERVTMDDIMATYPSRDAQLSRCTILARTHFNTDSARVWSEWKSLIQDGPGWNFVKHHKSTQNGRDAVQELKRQTEGMTGKTVRSKRGRLRSVSPG